MRRTFTCRKKSDLQQNLLNIAYSLGMILFNSRKLAKFFLSC